MISATELPACISQTDWVQRACVVLANLYTTVALRRRRMRPHRDPTRIAAE
jgi:hypothetical protein